MKKSIVSVCRSTPWTIREDYGRLLELIDCNDIKQSRKILIKVNHSHNKFFPSCSTPPWQLDSIINWLILKGINSEKIIVTENKTVCTNLDKVCKNHFWDTILNKYGVRFLQLNKTIWTKINVDYANLKMNWENIGDILVPEDIIGSYIIHLIPMKVHGHSIVTGSMKSAFSLFLPYKICHLAHKNIHEYLVDILYIQKFVLKCKTLGIIDATICGNGKGPVTLDPIEKNFILASTDLVALDTVSARMMGFDPKSIPHIKIAHENGLGCMDFSKIAMTGTDITKVNFNFKSCKNIVILTDQFLRKKMGNQIDFLFFKTILSHIAIFLSILYHNFFWYYFIAYRRIKLFNKTDWGRKFIQYKSF